jgi:SAM-dependent methyltransferase
MSVTCQVCRGAPVVAISNFERLLRVTSDCRPFKRQGKLCQCPACGAVQKLNDDQWRADCAVIYGAYDSYGLSEGLEQSVRSSDGADFAPRSDIILRQLKAAVGLPERGRLLDFGCGKGPTSQAASRVLSGWSIDGYDQDNRALPVLSTIEGFAKFHTGDPAALPGDYDLVVLMHVLEHLPEPAKMIRLLASKLRPGGHILCQVPDREANPYDLLVADHLVHFDRASIGTVVDQMGTPFRQVTYDWIAKELSLVLSDSGTAPARSSMRRAIDAQPQVDWLLQVAKTIRAAADRRPFCIFGTSIVATWLAGELDRPPDLYLDEDPAKIGRQIDGVPIVGPAEAPPGAIVALALAPGVAERVAHRLAPMRFDFVTLPSYPPA